jgi:predicted metal-binding membrane protein
VFGIAIHALDAALHALVRQSGWLAEHAPLIGPAVLALAGVYQFTPLKYHCLDKCRSPLSFITERWRGRREHWRPPDWASITAPCALAAAGR